MFMLEYRNMRSRSLAASLRCRRREANPNQWSLGSSKNVVTIMGKCGCLFFLFLDLMILVQKPKACTLVLPLKLTPCDKSRSHIRFTKFQRRSVLGVLCVVGCYIKRSQWNCCSFGPLASESSASKALGPQSSWSDWKADRLHVFRWW